MEYGPALEDDAQARAWLKENGQKFGHFIDGIYTKPSHCFDSCNPADNTFLAKLSQATKSDVERAVSAARKAQPAWNKLGGQRRSQYLLALSRMVEERAHLFAVLETLDSGMLIRESLEISIPSALRQFFYHAGLSRLQAEKPYPVRAPYGVCGLILPSRPSFLVLAKNIAPALAAGNTVVLKPDENASLTAHLFAEICNQAKLPSGVVNIVTGDGAVGEELVRHPDIDNIAFTGSISVGRKVREIAAASGIKLALTVGGNSPFVVFDDADIDSAIEDLIEAIWSMQGQAGGAGARLLVQESIASQFLSKLRARMDRLRVGNPLDKCTDVTAVISPAHLNAITERLEKYRTIETYAANVQLPNQGNFFVPTLISAPDPSSPLTPEEFAGPILVSTTFRSPAEAIILANKRRYVAATVWTENINLALDTATKLVSGAVGINSTNLSEADAEAGGKWVSGYASKGGRDGFYAYTKPPKKIRKPLDKSNGFSSSGSVLEVKGQPSKLYINGREMKPTGGNHYALYGKNKRILGYIPIATKEDLNRAVASADAAQIWSEKKSYERARTLYLLAENLDRRSVDIARRINSLTGTRTGKAEVRASVDQLLSYAAWADKFDGQTRQTSPHHIVLTMHQPLGVIGAICSNTPPLLGMVAVIAPAIAMGNRIVLLPSETLPLAAIDFYQVLDTSDLPSGVINVLTGSHLELARHLASNPKVKAIWNFSSSEVGTIVERESVTDLKHIWENGMIDKDWYQTDSDEFLRAAIKKKTIWIPYGS
ncbi:MAG: aldehyde dehydrogenase family protein [Aestuariivita sp.]|nr:aldehyde dehydrogenase family protein [Aestuariivita sp.]MCY4346480.1 aldehyde dehydrogenase family protein [Aestuariivita sp.]